MADGKDIDLSKLEEQLKRISKSRDESIKDLKEEIALEEKRLKVLTDVEKKIKSAQSISEKNLEIEELQLKIEKDIIKEKIKQNEENKKANKILEEQYEANNENYETDLKKLELREEELNKEKEILAVQQESIGALDTLTDRTKNLLGTLTGVGPEWKSTFTGQFLLASKTAGGMSLALSKMGNALKETFTPANILGGTLMKIQETTLKFAYQQDKALSGFNKSTGAAGAYNDLIMDLEKETFSFGVDTAEAAEAVSELKHIMSDFTTLGRTAQKDLAKLTAQFAELGISADISATNLQLSTKVLGMIVDQSIISKRNSKCGNFFGSCSS